MNLKYIPHFLSGIFLCFLFSSCNDDNNTTSYTSQTKDAQIYSFSIVGEHNTYLDSIPRAQDSLRFIEINKRIFSIDQVASIIYNSDSLPYGTQLRKLAVTASYNPTYGAGSVTITTPDSINGYLWNKTDSIDFSKSPVTFNVTSVGGTTKVYKIDMRIHKVDPDTLVWKSVSSFPQSIAKSKTLLVGDHTFYTYTVTDGSVTLYSLDKSNLQWETKVIEDLPSNINTESIFYMNGFFYAIDSSGNSYKSPNGTTWTNIANGKIVQCVLGVIPGATTSEDCLLLVIKDGDNNVFAKSVDLELINAVESVNGLNTGKEVPTNFPIEQVASFSNYSTDSRVRMLVLTGGLNNSGVELAFTWLIKNSSNGLEISPFIKNMLIKGAGLSNFRYDNLLYTLSGNQFYTSLTWGDNWTKAPSKQKLDTNIGVRSGQTVIVDGENNIWIFGGISGGAYQTTIWKGRLNKLNS